MLVIFELLYLTMTQQQYTELIHRLISESTSITGFTVHEYEYLKGGV